MVLMQACSFFNSGISKEYKIIGLRSSREEQELSLSVCGKLKWHDGQRRINGAGNVLGKIQPSKRRYELAFVFSCATRPRE